MRAANIFLLFLIAPVVGLLIALSGFVQLSEGLLLGQNRKGHGHQYRGPALKRKPCKI